MLEYEKKEYLEYSLEEHLKNLCGNFQSINLYIHH